MDTGKISITVLSDNHAAYGLEVEHGFSLWIETPGCNILFDTGQSTVMLNNADALGIRLSTTDVLAISHGHYDHAGNIAEVLRRAPRADIYLHENALCERYSIHGEAKLIGMPRASADAVTALSEAHRHWVTEPTCIAEGVWLTGPVPRLTSYEDTGGRFYLDEVGKTPDDIPDDLSLWIETTDGLVVCLGCCHAGVINTLRHITCISNKEHVSALIGGMHLRNANQERLEQTVDALRDYGILQIYPCHCTGDEVFEILSVLSADSVQQGFVGMKQTFHTQGNDEEDSK